MNREEILRQILFGNQHVDICTKLTQDYDASKLYSTNKETQNAFEEYSKLLLKNKHLFPNANIALATCVNNFFKKKKNYYPPYLSGVSRYSLYYSMEYKIWVYLFADRTHSLDKCKQKNSITIDEYLYKQIEESPHFIDFFNEYGVNTQCNNLKECHIKNIFKKFKDCHTKNRPTECPANARIHYADIRQTNQGDNAKEIFFSTLSEYRKYVEKYIEENKQVRKELEKLPPKLRKDIFNFYTEVCHKYIVSRRNKISKELQSKKWTEEFAAKNNLMYFYRLAYMFQMDLYLLTRLFKTYKKGPKTNKFSIIYVGETHVDVYEDFFKKMKFTRIEKVTNKKKLGDNCIELINQEQLFDYDEEIIRAEIEAGDFKEETKHRDYDDDM